MIGIYCVLNTLDGKRYIGQSVDVENRLLEHKYSVCSKVRHSNLLLQNAISKYGVENFRFFPLEECLREELNDLEIKYISRYRTYVGFKDCKGYNLTLGGDGTLGLKFSPEVSSKLSEALRRNWSNVDYRMKQSKSRSHKRTPEHCKAISEGIKKSGHFSSKDHMKYITEKAKIVNTNSKRSEETRSKISEALKGIKRSEETRLKISLSKSGKNSSVYGKIWINNGNCDKYINPNDLDSFIHDGWILGRKFSKRNRQHKI